MVSIPSRASDKGQCTMTTVAADSPSVPASVATKHVKSGEGAVIAPGVIKWRCKNNIIIYVAINSSDRSYKSTK